MHIIITCTLRREWDINAGLRSCLRSRGQTTFASRVSIGGDIAELFPFGELPVTPFSLYRPSRATDRAKPSVSPYLSFSLPVSLFSSPLSIFHLPFLL